MLLLLSVTLHINTCDSCICCYWLSVTPSESDDAKVVESKGATSSEFESKSGSQSYSPASSSASADKGMPE